jgi:hypothetical protein
VIGLTCEFRSRVALCGELTHASSPLSTLVASRISGRERLGRVDWRLPRCIGAREGWVGRKQGPRLCCLRQDQS